jgi:hypothetical protein
MSMIAKLNRHFDEVAHTHENPKTVEVARSMMIGYYDRWEKEDAKTKVRGIEVPFCVELPVPDDLPPWVKPSKPRYVGGIIDSIIERDGIMMATDMKTASRVTESYWTELNTNPQLTQYAFAMYAAGYERVGFIWDVVLKGDLVQKKLSKAAIADINAGNYCGWPVDVDVPEDGVESNRLYGLRLLSWYMENPQKYERRFAYRTESDLLGYVYNEHCTQSEMGLCAVRGGDRSWSCKNFGACHSYGTMCDYYSLCLGNNPEMLGFQPRKKRDGVPDLGITPSQSKCFNTCRQQWLYKYGKYRIEPIVKPKSVALDLGTLCHNARELILAARLENPIVLPLELGGA